MIVLAEEIRDEGLELDRELTKDFLVEILGGGKTGFSPAGPGRLEARFDRVGDKLLLKGEASVKVEGRCRRCLAAVQLDVPIQFLLNLVARPPEPPSKEGEGEALSEKHDLKGRGASFDLASVDDEAFDGRQIDLRAIVREQLLLALPMDGLCKDDCKGLCTLCGEDLNVRDCGCERKAIDPRWAALKEIKLNGKRGGS